MNIMQYIGIIIMVAATILLIICLMGLWKEFKTIVLTPKFVLSNDWMRSVMGVQQFSHIARDIYIGHCRDTDKKVSGIVAHVHIGNGNDICIFHARSLMNLEWTLAHEWAHIIAFRMNRTGSHNETWQSALNLIGYAEEWTNHISGYKSRPHESRDSKFTILAHAIMPEIAKRTPTFHAWATGKYLFPIARYQPKTRRSRG